MRKFPMNNSNTTDEDMNMVDNESNESETKEAEFETLSPLATSNQKQDINLIFDIPVNMSVELGRAKITIKELLKLTQGSIIGLEGLAGEPLDILINGYLIAQGELVVVGDNYGVRITDIITPSERVRRLSR
ncbi:flagellar motor switch protein FliN [Frischella perrara]|uniref:Flagellar motor switch protein FliN n=2 Tax=Frischella perrara TaxID=1267021 RepID=A0A318MRI1_FRIPE|nr:flagellar motor switch protein FliN [Frischella perrara]